MESKKSPAGAWQYEPVNIKKKTNPLMHTTRQATNPIMTDADMALKWTLNTEKFVNDFIKTLNTLQKFARAWFKLIIAI